MTDAADRASGPSATAAAIADPPRGAPGGTAPLLSVDGFTGPLDWLLEMVRAKQIDLARLSIAALIEAFADAMTAALERRHAIPIEHWAPWTVMAATLTELWSRLLLPPDVPEARAAAAEAEALGRQLLERARMREAAGWLERRPQLGHAAERLPAGAGRCRIRPPVAPPGRCRQHGSAAISHRPAGPTA